MKILVVGSGAREHAMVKKLKKSPLVTGLFAAPGNAGIAAEAECVDIGVTEIDKIVIFCTQNKIDLAVIGPEVPLSLGITDALNAKGIKVFGPSAAAAQIESSKVFSKNLMQKYGIPTAAYRAFDNAEAAKAYLEDVCFPTVIKADGLAAGKGVIIAENKVEALAALDEIMTAKQFGESGNQVVIEEFLTGVEVSVLAFCDGKTVVPMPAATDHKRIYDGDKGPNTGGMGTVAPSPVYTPQIAAECMEKIYLPTVEAMQKEGKPFKGCLFFGLILTAKGPYVIEYNCRFGDPETQVVLSLLESDLAEVILATAEQNLANVNVKFSDKTAVCVVMASGGYPGEYKKGLPISGILTAEEIEDIKVYHAATAFKNGEVVTAGGRVLGVTAVANTLKTALHTAYAGVEAITFENCTYRKDIGKKLL